MSPARLPEDTTSECSDPDIDSDDDDNDPALLQDKYVRIKSLLWKAEQKGKDQMTASRNRFINRLQDKLDRLRRDILFDQGAAELQWRSALIPLRARHAQEVKSARVKPDEKSLDSKWTEQDASNDEAEHGKSEEGDGIETEDLFGSMFAAADQLDTSGGEQRKGKDVKLVDFGQWAGVSPGRILEESCKTRDAKCRIQTHHIYNTSYSTRHRMQISWSIDSLPGSQAEAALPPESTVTISPRSWTLEMSGIAAATSAQSEAYISTLALFLVSTIGPRQPKFEARLPSTWRDLVKDMTAARQTLIDEEERSNLKRLRSLLNEVRQEVERPRIEDTEPRRKAQQNGADASGRQKKIMAPERFAPDRVLQEWALRTSRTSFQAMLEIRRQLPVHQFRDMILQTISSNRVSIICAETGAGKSSGIPVLLLEQEFSAGRDCRIMVTQPRRISAVTLARRVSQELGEGRNDLGTTRSLVGYAIRLESKITSTTRITYATTGVLLRMLENSPTLDGLDCLILDEVHERTMDLDLLFIALRRLLQLRQQLRIVLMSATVDARKFSEYFGKAPVLDLPGRTFPVEVGFLEDAIEVTRDVAEVEDKPPTIDDDEQEDIPHNSEDDGRISSVAGLESYSARTRSILSAMDEYRIDYGLIVNLAAAIVTKPQFRKYGAAILIFMPGLSEIRQLHSLLVSSDTFGKGWVVHLLHSSFSTEDLERAFERPPAGCRKIVIATNIAETGITIPDVTAVIDTCKEKVMRFDERRQLSKLTEAFISRSSARQRRGRAARVQEGLCFHLVTKYRHDHLMLEQQIPEMLRLSLQDPILRIKVWDLGPIEETLAAAIDPPPRKNVLRAIEKLKDAGALTKGDDLTPLGQQIARLPLEVTLAKLAILGVVFHCLVGRLPSSL